MVSVVESVASNAARFPSKLCLADRSCNLTYADIWRCIVSYAAVLEEYGISKGDFIAIECNQGAEFVVALLAVQLLGAIAVPIEKHASPSRRHDIAQKMHLAAFIGPYESDDLQADAYIPYGDINNSSAEFQTDWHKDFPVLDDISEIMFSTGTTGIPKGVVLTHRNDAAMSRNIIEGLQMKLDTVELIPVPINHSYGFRRINACLVNGSSCVICNGMLALKLVFDLMDDYHVNAMALAPNMLSILLKLSGERLSAYADELDYVQLSSAPLAEKDKTRLMELLPNTRLYNFYGSTEAGATCLYDFNAMADKPHCIGRPIGNSRFIVVDEYRNPIDSSPDHMGILASTGDVVMLGYFNDPELTKDTLEKGYVFTKDLGYIDDEGFVYIIGRSDDVINFGGIKVAPEEIEHDIRLNPVVRDCACIAIKDDIAGQVPILFISLEKGAEYDEKEFRCFIANTLEPNMRPQRVVVISDIPRAFNGKLRRKELMAQLSS